jgi:hypothetical protein
MTPAVDLFHRLPANGAASNGLFLYGIDRKIQTSLATLGNDSGRQSAVLTFGSTLDDTQMQIGKTGEPKPVFYVRNAKGTVTVSKPAALPK